MNDTSCLSESLNLSQYTQVTSWVLTFSILIDYLLQIFANATLFCGHFEVNYDTKRI